MGDGGGQAEANELDRLLRVPEHRKGGGGVHHERGADDAQDARDPAGPLLDAVPALTHDGVEQHQGNGPVRLRGGQFHDQATTHRVPRQHGPADAQVVHDPADQRRVFGEVTTAGRQAEGPAVAGGVDGDDPVAHAHQAGQGLGVEDPFGREAVDHHQGDALAGHRHADLVAVGQGHRGLGQPGVGPTTFDRGKRPGPFRAHQRIGQVVGNGDQPFVGDDRRPQPNRI